MSRLLAIDLDGTLLGNNLAISPAVKRAVLLAVEQGVRVAIVTGRMFAAARPFALQLELEGEIVCYQGAAIYDIRSRELLRETPLKREIALRVAQRGLADGKHVQLYHDDAFYVQSVNEWSQLYAHLSGVQPVVVASLPDTFANWDSTKVVVVAQPEEAAGYLGVVRELCGADAYITRSQPEFIEAIDPGVDKGRALHWLAKRHGIALDATIAIGDSWNDLPLLEAAAIGIAMGSAPPELMARADAVVGDWHSDGVAEAIEKYVLQ